MSGFEPFNIGWFDVSGTAVAMSVFSPSVSVRLMKDENHGGGFQRRHPIGRDHGWYSETTYCREGPGVEFRDDIL